MFADPFSIVAVLCFNVVVCELLCRATFLRHVGTALLVIVVTGVEVNLGVVPAYDSSSTVYNAIFGPVVEIGIFWMLLRVRLNDILRAGLPMLLLFALGALGTVSGVLVGMWAVDGAQSIGENFHAIGGMFVATYTGGSANLAHVATEYSVQDTVVLFVGTNAVDAILTTVWMVASIAIPRFLGRRFPGRRRMGTSDEPTEPSVDPDRGSVSPVDLGWLLGLGAVGLAARDWLHGQFPDIPKAVFLTTIALALAQVPFVSKLEGGRPLGMFALYLFLAVIGALCDLEALEQLGELAGTLWTFASIVIVVHGLVVFGGAALFRADWDMAAVASQANVGGGTSAIALARSLARSDLVLPGILIGSLGTASGTYLGLAVARWLES